MRTRGGYQSILIQDDRGRWKNTELAMIHEAEGLKKAEEEDSEQRIQGRLGGN
jgi:hypothetical protein